MDAGPRIDSYTWAGGREPMLRFGPDDGPVAVLALPLFEEANRTRAFGASVLRAVAARGIGGVLPELPGQGESAVATNAATLGDLRAALSSAAGTHVLAIRSGALVCDDRPCWLFAPQSGAELIRELTRVNGGAMDGDEIDIAGNMLTRSLVGDLATARHREGARVVRLSSDPRAADMHVDGPALWRRAEPDNDIQLAERLAADIAEWMTTCAG